MRPGAHRYVGRAKGSGPRRSTLATAAGNNLARWLTALPPNISMRAAYRGLLKDFARRLRLAYTFYGETQLRRLGAGAFLAVSRGNGTRDAGIVRLVLPAARRARRPRSAWSARASASTPAAPT